MLTVPCTLIYLLYFKIWNYYIRLLQSRIIQTQSLGVNTPPPRGSPTQERTARGGLISHRSKALCARRAPATPRTRTSSLIRDAARACQAHRTREIKKQRGSVWSHRRHRARPQFCGRALPQHSPRARTVPGVRPDSHTLCEAEANTERARAREAMP